ncbi:MAG: hypothetical protein AAFX93_20515 [Verrucomicrobiota bacterium]
MSEKYEDTTFAEPDPSENKTEADCVEWIANRYSFPRDVVTNNYAYYSEGIGFHGNWEEDKKFFFPHWTIRGIQMIPDPRVAWIMPNADSLAFLIRNDLLSGDNVSPEAAQKAILSRENFEFKGIPIDGEVSMMLEYDDQFIEKLPMFKRWKYRRLKKDYFGPRRF